MNRRNFIFTTGAAVVGAAGAPAEAFTMEEKKMYGLIGKMTVVPGQRDALIAILLEGVAGMPGCLSYVVAKDPADENAIWITEVWDSQASHKASLSLPSVKQAIARGKPLIAGFGQSIVTEPVGGYGLGGVKKQLSASAAEEQVKAAMRRYDQLALAMNAEGIAAMFTSDGELIDAGRTVARTPASILAFLKSFDGKVRVEENASSIESITVAGATAILTGTYQQKALLLADKREIRVQGKFEAEWIRQADGQWLIRRLSTQSTPPR
jgi:quinol monooxygenase YgiN/ketosteroid isomerase-like protein